MFNITCVTLILIIIQIARLPVSGQFSKHFQLCNIAEEDCLNGAIQDAIHQVAEKGFPEMNVPKLDPVFIPSLEITRNGNVINAKQKYTDMKLFGYHEAIVTNSHVDKNMKHITFTTYLPHMNQDAKYDITGNILIIPIIGNGRSLYKMENASIIHDIHFEDRMDHGNLYWKVNSYVLDVRIQKLVCQFENLFDGNKDLSDKVHAAFNENWDAVWKDVKEDFENVYGTVFKMYTERVFSQIPLKDFFL